MYFISSDVMYKAGRGDVVLYFIETLLYVIKTSPVHLFTVTGFAMYTYFN